MDNPYHVTVEDIDKYKQLMSEYIECEDAHKRFQILDKVVDVIAPYIELAMMDSINDEFENFATIDDVFKKERIINNGIKEYQVFNVKR